MTSKILIAFLITLFFVVGMYMMTIIINDCGLWQTMLYGKHAALAWMTGSCR